MDFIYRHTNQSDIEAPRKSTLRKWLAFLIVLLIIVILFCLPFVWPHPKQTYRTRINPIDSAEMVYVPAGECIIGDRSSRHNPRRTANVDGFWLYRYEVTVKQYKAFCLATNRSMPKPPSWGWVDDYPMTNISWQAAADYARWAGGRLPTEIEWEKTARGTDGRKFPWGNRWDASKCANSWEKQNDQPFAVGSFPEDISPYGAYDMAGNVEEWCNDDHVYVQENGTKEVYKNVRGGSYGGYGEGWFVILPLPFYTDGGWGANPLLHYEYIGFRCVIPDHP